MISRTYINLQQKDTIWHSADIEQIFDILKSSPDGISQDEAVARQEKLGLNTIHIERRDTIAKIILRQFLNPVSIILIIGAIISILLKHNFDTAIIIATVVVNISIGFFQEYRVSKIFDKLRDYVQYSTKIKRGGKIMTINSVEVTRGDILVLRPGDKIVADARIISADNISVNEAILTGESMPVEKKSGVIAKNLPISEQRNMLFAGTFIETGVALAIVTKIGTQTEIGKISRYIQDSMADEVTPLQKQLGAITRNLSLIFMILAGLLFIVGSFTDKDINSLFLTAVAIAVAAIPEGLPIALTAALAHGSAIILKRGGVIRKLTSAETLGSTSIIAMDKTGTLTIGDMRLAKIILPSGQECTTLGCNLNEISPSKNKKLLSQIIEYGTLISNAIFTNKDSLLTAGNPIDRALLLAGYENGIIKESLLKYYKISGEIPFQAQHKYQAIKFTDQLSGDKIISLGAAEIIIDKCDDTIEHRDFKLIIESYANQGFRVLAMASKDIKEDVPKIKHEQIKDLKLEAILIFSDPIRPEVTKAVKEARLAGVKSIVISGDHLLTTQYIARELEIITHNSEAVDGRHLGDITPNIVKKYIVFARTTPEQKIQIIKALQHDGNIVSMIGDGVNDAPALIQSDIGIAVDSGTDIAKEASDMILQKSSFAVVIEAVKQGRIIIDNIRKVMFFMLASSCAELVIIAGSILAGLPAGLLPSQILYVNIIVDILPAIALVYSMNKTDILKSKPEDYKNLMPKNLVKILILFALISNALLFALFYIIFGNTGNVDLARSATFVALGVSVLFSVFSISFMQESLSINKIFDNKILVYSVLIGLLLYAVALYIPRLAILLGAIPLSLDYLLLVFIFAIINTLILELLKIKFIKVDKNQRGV